MKSAACITCPALDWNQEDEQTRMIHIMRAEDVSSGGMEFETPGWQLFAAVVRAVCAEWPDRSKEMR
jgi:hypothetical protein